MLVRFVTAEPQWEPHARIFLLSAQGPKEVRALAADEQVEALLRVAGVAEGLGPCPSWQGWTGKGWACLGPGCDVVRGWPPPSV